MLRTLRLLRLNNLSYGCRYKLVDAQSNCLQFTIDINCPVVFLTAPVSPRNQQWQDAGGIAGVLKLAASKPLYSLQRPPAEPKRIIRLGLQWLTGLGVRAP
jgi:hypothetical protein